MEKCNTPIPQQTNSQPVYLRDTSTTGKRRPWKEQKVRSLAIGASLMRNASKHHKPELRKRGSRVYSCSTRLIFQKVTDGKKEGRKLVGADFCRDRLCAMCQWRKSIVAFVQVSRVIDEIMKADPNLVVLFLTLTTRNVGPGELRAEIDRQLSAWSKMTSNSTNRQWRRRGFVGWFRTVEITYNRETGEWHPHIHAIVLVRRSYFERGTFTWGRDHEERLMYLPHHDTTIDMKNDADLSDSWVGWWRRFARLDYNPSVDVRVVESGRQSKALKEVTKYAVKPGDWLSEDEEETDRNTYLLAYALRGVRLTAMGGNMKEVAAALKLVDPDEADLVAVTDDDELRAEVIDAIEVYEWQAGVTNDYVLVGSDAVGEV